jgi:hypothetical protein
MNDAGRIKPLEPHPFFTDGMSARPGVPGTIPRGSLVADPLFEEGRLAGEFAAHFPEPVTEEMLGRGRARYEIFCAPCHDRAGFGRGMVVQRGFRAPSSFHVERLRDAPPGYFVDAIRNGFGAMASYRKQVGAADRWAITAWIRALQLSQHAPESRLAEQDRAALSRAPR